MLHPGVIGARQAPENLVYIFPPMCRILLSGEADAFFGAEGTHLPMIAPKNAARQSQETKNTIRRARCCPSAV